MIQSNTIQSRSYYFTHFSEIMQPVANSNSVWKLCYRASYHGWATSIFHRNCDGKRDTVTIIRKDQYVFGGYTDIPWGKKIWNKKKKFIYRYIIFISCPKFQLTIEFIMVMLLCQLVRSVFWRAGRVKWMMLYSLIFIFSYKLTALEARSKLAHSSSNSLSVDFWQEARRRADSTYQIW